MKKTIIAIFLMYFTTSVFSQSNIADASAQLPNYDFKTKMAFDFSNDSNNLYLVFKVADPRTQLKIARAGMSIDFATKIKPKRKAEIVFPLFIEEKQVKEQHNKTGLEKKEPFQIKQKYFLSPPAVQFAGFAFTNGNISVNKSSNKMNYSVQWDSLNEMFIEFRIPLKELFGDNFDLKNITQKDISIKLTENALQHQGSSGEEGGAGRGGGMGHGGGGMGHGGGSMGHGGGGNHGDYNRSGDQNGAEERASMYEIQKFKQKFKLNNNVK